MVRVAFTLVRQKDGKPLEAVNDDCLRVERTAKNQFKVSSTLCAQPGKIVQRMLFDELDECLKYVAGTLALLACDIDPYWAIQADIGVAPSVLIKPLDMWSSIRHLEVLMRATLKQPHD